MSTIERPANETFALIRDTLLERDPYGECILLGSAAVFMHFYNANLVAPIGCGDIDALCSQEFFDRTSRGLGEIPGLSKAQVRWPKGRLKLRHAKNMSIDLYPEEGAALLPFTVAHDMSDAWVPETYEDARKIAVDRSGIRCKPLMAITMQIARIGREKDILNVEKIVPSALEGGLLDPTQQQTIERELNITHAHRRRHPELYYARVDI